MSGETQGAGAPIPRREFVALVAAIMSMVAIGIDSMLPALPDIARRLHIATLADRGLIVTFFVVGLGIGQLVCGPVTDRFGRRPVMIGGLLAYTVANIACAWSGSFALLLAARLAGGLAVSAGRVVTVALIRDCFSGRAMAQVSSLAYMVFMAVPILAPAYGQAVLLIGTWRLIFWSIAAFALLVLCWFAWRMPETQAPGDRMPFSFARLADGWRQTLGDRLSLGYTAGALLMQVAVFGYLGSIQPIMEDVFGRPELLAPVFAASAGTMALANLLNSRVVMRLGMRRLSHGALCGMALASGVAAVVAGAGHENLLTFALLQALSMASFGLAASNMQALAMQNMGHIAGVAASVQGFATVTVGAVLGGVVGRLFDGTTVPLHACFCLTALLALAVAAAVERGRLFQPA